MKFIKLSDYKKPLKTKIESCITGINIEKRQKQFIEKHGINLSSLVRAVIDSVMDDESQEQLKSLNKK